jgi:hypothetical protein
VEEERGVIVRVYPLTCKEARQTTTMVDIPSYKSMRSLILVGFCSLSLPAISQGFSKDILSKRHPISRQQSSQSLSFGLKQKNWRTVCNLPLFSSLEDDEVSFGLEEEDDTAYAPSESFESEASIALAANDIAAANNNIELQQEVSNSFLQYALSIILGRALPDARDGLKPVHRRILYSMQQLSLMPTTPHRKCARVVGEVLGKYHPHGDLAVYDALVRMAQDFSTHYRLIDGHGNFGSVDADPAAAMRYTECRLTQLATTALFTDLGDDTVDFIPNFDGNEVEPTVLPAKLPLLLLNGSSGIAVGECNKNNIVRFGGMVLLALCSHVC